MHLRLATRGQHDSGDSQHWIVKGDSLLHYNGIYAKRETRAAVRCHHFYPFQFHNFFSHYEMPETFAVRYVYFQHFVAVIFILREYFGH